MPKNTKPITISDLVLDNKNANLGTDRGKQLLAQSLKELGAGRSIVCDRNHKVIGGNKTLEQAIELGLEIETIHTKGDKLVAVIRDDLDLDTDQRARALAFSDNRIAELDLTWDVEQILENIDENNIEGLWTEEELSRLQDGIDLATFEALADDDINEGDEPEDKLDKTKDDSDMVPFHCLLTQQQRERVLKAINQAKSKHGLETTGEALDIISRNYINE